MHSYTCHNAERVLIFLNKLVSSQQGKGVWQRWDTMAWVMADPPMLVRSSGSAHAANLQTCCLRSREKACCHRSPSLGKYSEMTVPFSVFGRQTSASSASFKLYHKHKGKGEGTRKQATWEAIYFHLPGPHEYNSPSFSSAPFPFLETSHPRNKVSN